MTPERLMEIERRAFTTTPFEDNIGFSGLSADEAKELIEAVRHYNNGVVEPMLSKMNRLLVERDLENEVLRKGLEEIAASPSSYLWATLTGIAREALAASKKPTGAR